MLVDTLGRAPLTYRPSSLGNFRCQVLSPPCGQATASQADELITRRLKESLALLDIRVLDHFIVANNVVSSMAVQGLL